MTHVFKKDSYEDILSNFDVAIKWLEECGASIEPTRVNKYRKTLNLLIEAYKKGTTQEMLNRGEFPKIVNSFFEIKEITDIWVGLKEMDNEELETRLRKFVKGPESMVDELLRTSSNYPRNIGFELYIASRFAISDFDINLSSDGDISALYKNNSLFIECKRPNQLNKLEKNIKRAFNQLEERYKTINTESAGIIALSINKLINPKQKLLVEDSLDNLSHHLGKLVENFIKEYRYFWQGKNKERTIGVLVSLQAPCIIKNQNLLTIGREMGMNNITIPGTEAHSLLMDIAERLDKGTHLL